MNSKALEQAHSILRMQFSWEQVIAMRNAVDILMAAKLDEFKAEIAAAKQSDILPKHRVHQNCPTCTCQEQL